MVAKPRSQAAELKALERQSVLFEWYVNHAWNFHRRFVKKHLSPRCNRCAASTKFLPLDAHGMCTPCRETSSAGSANPDSAMLAQLERQLDETLTQAQGRGTNIYDVLVLFSGGKDSIFLIHELKRRYPKLRILAYLVDSGMMGPRTLINAQKATDKLEVDYVHFKPNVEFFRTLYREAALFEKLGYGCLQTGDLLEFYTILSMCSRYAVQAGISYVVDGLNWAQIELIWGGEYQTANHTMLGRLAHIPNEILSPQTRERFENYFQAPGAPPFLHPFYAWRFTENEIRKLVIDQGYVEKGSDSPVLTNNQFVSTMFFIDYARLGYGSYEGDICAQVRKGTADRIYWRNIFEMAEYSAKTGWLIKDIVAAFQKRVGLTGNAFKLSWYKD